MEPEPSKAAIAAASVVALLAVVMMLLPSQANSEEAPRGPEVSSNR